MVNIPFLSKKKKQNKISAYFINSYGKVEIIKIDPDLEKIEYDGGTYITDKSARLTDQENRPLFMYIKGKPAPLIFNKEKIKFLDTIKIDARPLKAVLRAKLFGDLLSGDNPKPWDIIMDVLLIVNMILNIVIVLKVTGVIDAVLQNG